MFKTNDGLPAITQLAHVTIKSRDHTHLPVRFGTNHRALILRSIRFFQQRFR